MKRRTTLAVLVLAAACDAGPDPKPPQACMPIEAVVLHIGETARFTACFTDENTATLVYVASSSAPSVVKATAVMAEIMLEALALGEATITIVATDEDGLSASLRFAITVPNRAPEWCFELPSDAFETSVGNTVFVETCFEDPDGDEVTFTAASSDTDVVITEIRDRNDGRTAEVVLVGAGVGEASVTIEAADPHGAAAKASLATRVPNRPPMVCRALPGASVVYVDGTKAYPVCVRDPDGQPLTYSVSAGPIVQAELNATHDTVFVTGKELGETMVRFSATDPNGGRAETEMTVDVTQRTILVDDDFSEDSGLWNATKSVSDRAKIGEGEYEIRDGVMAARCTDGTAGWGGAELEIEGEEWTVQTRTRSTQPDFTNQTALFVDGDGVGYWFVAGGTAYGTHAVFVRVLHKWSDRFEDWEFVDDLQESYLSGVPNYAWFNMSISVERGVARFYVNDELALEIQDERGIISRLQKVSLSAFDQCTGDAVEWDFIRVLTVPAP